MTHTLELPAALRARTEPLLDQWVAATSGQDWARRLEPMEIERVFACSDFVARNCIRAPELLGDLVASGDLFASYDDTTPATRVGAALAATSGESDLLPALRRLRKREMIRIAWRDIAGRAALDETLRDLSALADACIDGALTYLERHATPVWGTPTASGGAPQRLVVIAMGKLGAHELNFSSDVDLIFAYPENGATRGGARELANSEYFVRLGQQLVNALNQTTADGFVFRVDLRLRPFGEAGALALDFDAIEQYYQEHGREWERYALIKARICAGDRAAGEQLLRSLRPFVYRRYLDFNAFDSLREMKQLIALEGRRKNYDRNVKLGSGGIREIEFIGQAFQLIRGGRKPELRERRIQRVLELLRIAQHLPDFVVNELQAAYVFLRNSEHRLQQVADQQTHDLPKDDEGQARLAYAMGFADWTGYHAELNRHRARVHNHFEQVFAAPQAEASGAEASPFTAVWTGALTEDAARTALADAGFAGPDAARDLIAQLRASGPVRALSPIGHQRLGQLIPLLLGSVARAPRPDDTLPRVLRLLESIVRRITYVSLLVENPMALSQLVKLCAASPWIAELLRRHPILLDELLDPRTLYAPPDAVALQVELAHRLAALAPDDFEQHLEALRHFKQGNALRVAAADISDALPLMQVSDHLSWIADAVLDATLRLAWNDLVAKHGAPQCRLDDAVCDRGFAIVAYGKLGGLELGYGSDLDLVFLYTTADDDAPTTGPKPIPAAVFFARLAQRIIHILTAHTPMGVLYEVDLRLRPSGASGLLVTSLDAFADYQRTQAWTWEHQALIRARPITGDARVLDKFDAIRREVLGRARDLDKLRGEVRDMREKMRASLLPRGLKGFDLKQSPGGIVDIEFIVQFSVLAWAHAEPRLLDFPDNIRQIEILAKAGKLSREEATALIDAYRTYRARQHKLTLLGNEAIVDEGDYAGMRDAVLAVWGRLLG
jgi:glutamate-ammonia-ligase adenylyltransferase